MYNKATDAQSLEQLKAQHSKQLPAIYHLSDFVDISETSLQRVKRKLPIPADGTQYAQKRSFYKEITSNL